MMESVLTVLAFAIVAGFGANIGWGAAQSLRELIDAFFAGYFRGRAIRLAVKAREGK